MPIDPFSGLPAPNFFSSDPTVLAQAFIIGYEAGYQAFTGNTLTLGQADPRYYEQLYNAFLISQTYANGNIVAYQNLLRYAVGSNLDELGSFWGLLGVRLPASGALTTLVFTITAPASVAITIPIGTQVASFGTSSTIISFATTAIATILAGSTTISAPAQCTVTGAIGNGFIPGQITNLLNWSTPYVVSVSNSTTSAGGGDLETDDAFRVRLYMAPKALSTCGTQAGYEFFALSANSAITDVSVWSNPGISGTVMIAALLAGGIPPGSDVNTQIYNACSGLNNRPLSDQVIVTNPTAVAYSINVSYYIPQALKANVVDLQAAVQTAVSTFQTNTQAVLGEYIDPTILETAIGNLGVIGVTVTAPIFYNCNPWEQPTLVDDPSVNYLGLI